MKSSKARVLRTGVNSFLKNTASRYYLARARDAWGMTEEQFWAHQSHAFANTYAFARRSVPYYQEYHEQYPDLGTDGTIFEMLSSLPILEKSTVKAQNENFWPRPLQRYTSIHTTSGTSGTPLRIPATFSERAFATANLRSWYERIIGSPNPRILSLSGFMSPEPGSQDLCWRDRIGNRLFLSIYSLNLANKDRIGTMISQFRPQMIYGYASAINQLAELFLGTPLEGQTGRIATSTSEVLTPDWRVNIEESLARKVFDLYGSQEGAHVVFQCGHGSMHINPLVGVVEIVDSDGKHAPAGVPGRVLVTSLLRKSFPLVRYDIGDTAVSTGYSTDCECGTKWPTIGHVYGRAEDLVVARDGRRIGYLCFHATKDLSGIQESQLIQRAYDRFEFRIVPSAVEPLDRSFIEASIRRNIEIRLQSEISINFSYLPSIPRGPRGKFNAVVVDFDASDSR